MCEHIIVSAFRKCIADATMEIVYCTSCHKLLNERNITNYATPKKIVLQPPVRITTKSLRDITSYSQPGVG
jgi:hypothetical protein